MSIHKKLFEVKKEGVTLQRDTKAFNYKYATLDQIQEKLNPILESKKLLVVHSIQGGSLVTTVFDIESEDSVSSSIGLTTTKPQDKGSEITYYRRYNLVSLFDLEVEDDDGKKAQDSKTEKKRFNPGTEERNRAVAAKAGIETIKQKRNISKKNEELYLQTMQG